MNEPHEIDGIRTLKRNFPEITQILGALQTYRGQPHTEGLDKKADKRLDKKGAKVLTLFMPSTRKYANSHHWLTFKMGDLVNRLGAHGWLNLGASFSKCEYLLRAPIAPRMASKLGQIYMRRGAWATAQIEGNPLSQEQFNASLDEKGKFPKSQQYSVMEISNVISALKALESEIAVRKASRLAVSQVFEVTPEWIKGMNKQLLAGLKLEEYVIPGQYRTYDVGVNTYKGAPHQDLEYLMEEFCKWFNSLMKDSNDAARGGDPLLGFATTFIAAALAHLYFAWIHPFGDGNGRTARLIECAILANSDLVPWISTNILSDYYNKTRDSYYERLEAASANSDVVGFVNYSIRGFLEQVGEQVIEVQKFQRQISWISYIHEQFSKSPANVKSRRQKVLSLHLQEEIPVTIKDLLTNEHLIIKTIYSTLSVKTLKRDLEELNAMGLVYSIDGKTYQANIRIMDGFNPLPELGSH